MAEGRTRLVEAIRRRQDPRAGLVVGGAILLLVGGLDVGFGERAILAGTVVLAPPAAALFGDSRATSAVGLAAVLLVALSGIWNENFGTLDYWLRLVVVVAGTLFAVVTARLQELWSSTVLEQALVSEERAEIGDVLQRGLMPPRIPETPGWSIGTLFRPGGAQNEVGGDFYDVFPFGAGWMAVIGDITGRGAGAASLTAQARHALRTSRTLTNDPQEILATLNDLLLSQEESELCSLLAFFFGPGDTVALALAGHPPPLLVTESDVCEVGRTGPLLGAFPDGDWPIESVRVATGSHLVAYTDGVTEAPGASGRFDVERLCEAVAPSRGPAGAIHAIETALGDFVGGAELHDDMTLLAVGRAPQLIEQAEPAGLLDTSGVSSKGPGPI